ncbi:MAG: O-antigen ligase family protein [Terricaulis sp.]
MLLIAYLPEIAAFLLFIMLSTQLSEIGPLLVLGEMGLVGLLFLLRPAAFVQTMLRWWPLLLVPVLATLSALWSDAPMASARYGAQLLFTAFVGVHLTRLMTPGRFATVFMLAMFVFCVLCVLHGRQGPSAEGMVLIGLTGSKNQLGFAALFLLLSALTNLMMGGVNVMLRWVAVLALPLAGYLLIETNATTAVLMAAGGALALIGLWFMQRLPAGGRVAVIAGVVLVAAPLSLLIPEANAWLNHFVFDTLNKDPTLTGRTLLWARADELIERRPLLGYGYQAIWMGDSFETIGLKRLTGMTDGRVFHFHHQFRQLAVDTGYLGLVTFIVALAATAFAGLRQLLLTPHPATSFFYAMFVLMVARAFTDTILTPFTVHTVIFFACSAYAFWRPSTAPAEAHARGVTAWPAWMPAPIGYPSRRQP